ncbi:hypothetical protein BDP27DRAFT_1451617 [Rhodocollybia butyracea]|uniref:Uncharacterized protein n=1 Tax=Rhodocollybia butyracea TaxID=206335 RepID=A0A9P5PII6_9AGAR|nr:hypothetical protein BDP27DRAFT_1451617 [Rhodocollybia butyracea]
MSAWFSHFSGVLQALNEKEIELDVDPEDKISLVQENVEEQEFHQYSSGLFLLEDNYPMTRRLREQIFSLSSSELCASACL